jgi:uncharacterized membrane protein
VSRPAQNAAIALCGVAFVLFYALALARWGTFHNETFDLAFYARISWALAQFDPREPIVGGHWLGLHISPVLVPLGWLGHLLGQVPVLLCAQSAAVAAAAIPLGRMAARRFGDGGGLAAVAAWLLYPNISHVAVFEFHPGTLAVLPLAWAMDALDRVSRRGLIIAVLGVLACREDLALVTAMIGVLAAVRHPELRRTGVVIAVGSLLYLGVFLLVLHPIYAPPQGSMELHFGKWGGSASAAIGYLLMHPGELVEHLSTPERLGYLPKVLAPLALLPLLKPRWLLIAAPVLAMNLISEFRTTTWIDSHYLTPAVPALIAGAIDGATVPARRWGSTATDRWGRWVLLVPALVAHLIAGGTPLAPFWFAWGSFRPDARTEIGRAIVAEIPDGASVQAPDALLPHLAERRLVYRAPPPERDAEYTVLNLAHRERYRHHENVLRTVEEPFARAWLAREDQALLVAELPWALSKRGMHPREGIAGRYFEGSADPEAGQAIARCLSVLGARLRGRTLILDLVAREACASDLAVRLGTEARPRRVDLLFDGWLSPVHLRRGDRVWSPHRLGEREAAAFAREGVRVGALRSSGARVDPGDPTAVDVIVVVDPR